MANHLKVAEVLTIQALFDQGWSQRRIARELGINRETVARHLNLRSKPAKAPTGSANPKPATDDKAPTGSTDSASNSKPATGDKAPTGSVEGESGSVEGERAGGRSLCFPFREVTHMVTLRREISTGVYAQNLNN